MADCCSARTDLYRQHCADGVFDVVLDGMRADSQIAGDLLVGLTEQNQLDRRNFSGTTMEPVQDLSDLHFIPDDPLN